MAISTFTVTNMHTTDHGVTHTDPVSRTASQAPHLSVVLGSMLAVAAAAVVMWFAFSTWIKPNIVHISTGYFPLAAIVAITAALERLLEPLSSFLNPPGAKPAQVNRAKKAARDAADDRTKTNAYVGPLVQDAADKLAQLRADRTIFYWAIASICGLGIAGGFGFLLLQSVASNHVNGFLDLAVTGFAIGAGTKPLHDLITGMQSKSK
jgi:hypothetical protein